MAIHEGASVELLFQSKNRHKNLFSFEKKIAIKNNVFG